MTAVPVPNLGPDDQDLAAAFDTLDRYDPKAAEDCAAALEILDERRDRRADRWVERIIAAAENVRATGRSEIASEAATLLASLQSAPPAAPPAVPAPSHGVGVQPERPAAPAHDRDARRVLGMAALLFGIAIWVPGAHYQLDGWTIITNAILDLVRSGLQLPLATGWWALLLIPFGVMYSVGERRYLPLRRRTVTNAKTRKKEQRWIFLGWGVLLVWTLVNGSDLLSAYVGISQPPADDAWPITHWMARTRWATIAWMIVVVYVGDILLFLGWRWVGLRWPWSRR